MQNWTGQPPNLYDISGSAHFVNKCDNGIVIHRNRNPNAGPIDQVQVRTFVWSPAYACVYIANFSTSLVDNRIYMIILYCTETMAYSLFSFLSPFKPKSFLFMYLSPSLFLDTSLLISFMTCRFWSGRLEIR